MYINELKYPQLSSARLILYRGLPKADMKGQWGSAACMDNKPADIRNKLDELSKDLNVHLFNFSIRKKELLFDPNFLNQAVLPLK